MQPVLWLQQCARYLEFTMLVIINVGAQWQDQVCIAKEIKAFYRDFIKINYFLHHKNGFSQNVF